MAASQSEPAGGSLRKNGTPRIRIAAKVLKRVCTNAPAIAASASAPEAENAAIRPVTVVPMLAPTTNGNRVRTLNLPEAASGTVSAVVVEEDCTRVVMAAPESTPTKAFLPRAA